MEGLDINAHGIVVHNEKLSEVTYSPTTRDWTLEHGPYIGILSSWD